MFAVLGASLDREAQRREYDAAAKSRTENGAHGKSATAQGTDGKHKNGGAPAGKADSDGWVSEEEGKQCIASRCPIVVQRADCHLFTCPNRRRH